MIEIKLVAVPFCIALIATLVGAVIIDNDDLAIHIVILDLIVALFYLILGIIWLCNHIKFV
jgi:hypothetical protein